MTTDVAERVAALVRSGDVKALKALHQQVKHEVDARGADARRARWGADPVGWVTGRLRQYAWSKQREVLESVRDHRRTAVKSGHGVGKSHTAAAATAWWLDTHAPGTAFVVTTAPTGAQIKAILWRYIRRMHAAAGLPGRVNTTEWHLGGELVAVGRKPSDHAESAFQGIHASYVLVILDEACGIPANLWVSADALTTNDGCALLAIGNPDNPASEFRKVCAPGSGWHVITISAFDSPNLTGELVPPDLAHALVGRAWVEEKRREWGEDNPIYRSKVLGEFTQDGTWQVVRSSDLTACRIDGDGRRWQADALLPVELGVDVGGGGDETVVRERTGRRAGREWRDHTDRPEQIVPLVLAAIRQTGATCVKVDSIGVGAGVVGELRNRAGEHGCDVVAVNVAESANDDVKFANKRAEMWWVIGREMSESHAQDPAKGWDLSRMENADTTCAQLLEPQWSTDARGRILVEPKKDVIKRLGRSPDNADALLLAFMQGAEFRVRFV